MPETVADYEKIIAEWAEPFRRHKEGEENKCGDDCCGCTMMTDTEIVAQALCRAIGIFDRFERVLKEMSFDVRTFQDIRNKAWKLEDPE